LQKAYSNLGYRPGAFPVTDSAADTIMSLPMYPGLTEQQQRHVIEALLAAYVSRNEAAIASATK
jgi:dTDP-4-amino-4,6-dideoxygalactose transaminase